MKSILLIDNYDSYTYNLYQLIAALLAGHGTVDVVRNDLISLQETKRRNYTHFVISPGPGRPDDPTAFGVSGELLRAGGDTPILGVCLGMQGIALRYGGRIVRAPRPMHGVRSTIVHDGKGVFAKVPSPTVVMRYHSLVVDEGALPEELEVTARLRDIEEGRDLVMGLRHRSLPIEGIQFHPESFGTPEGRQMLTNFLGENKGDRAVRQRISLR
jgi:anthranilate synthase component 2